MTGDAPFFLDGNIRSVRPWRPQSRALMAAFAGLLSAFPITGCGPKSFAVGTVPFPAPNPVLVDASGQPRQGLPDSPEPFRIVLLDYAWCPPCDNVWKAIREASREIPEGSVRVYRILFDRERLLDREATTEVAPMNPSAAMDAGTLPVTTVAALAGPFRKQFEPEQAPILLLTDRNGKVLKRWTGAFPSLPAAIVSEVRRVSSAPPLPGM